MMKDLRRVITDTIRESIPSRATWYHGTPDAREIEQAGGFTHKTMTVDYVEDVKGFKQTQANMNTARERGDMDLYHDLLDTIPSFKKTFTYKKPVFLSNNYSVAKTYADPKRAFDYQNAVERVYAVDVDCNRVAKIIATGDRFRFIAVDKVRKGFIDAGVPEHVIDELISMFNYYIEDDRGMKTDVIAAIGSWLEFDCIDVVGVLDSYHGGKVRSTVRMVLDPSKVKLKR